MKLMSAPFDLPPKETANSRTDEANCAEAEQFSSWRRGIRALIYAVLSAIVATAPAAQAQLLSRPSTKPAASAPALPQPPGPPSGAGDVRIDAWETGRSQDDLIVDLIQACKLEAQEAVDEAAAANRKTLDDAGSVMKAKQSVAEAARRIVFNKISWSDALDNAQVIEDQTSLSNPREAKYLICIYKRRYFQAFSF